MSRMDNEIARRVMAARKDAGLSQGEVGAKLGMTETGFGHYERGRSPWTAEMLFRLAPILGKPVAYFLGLDTGLAPDEDELLAAYRSVGDAEGKAMVLRVVKAATVKR